MKNNVLKQILVGLAASGLVGAPLSVLAGASANQTVTFEIRAISELSVSGNPGNLTVSAATAGSVPTLASDASTTYNYTANQPRKITAALNTALPAGVTLSVALASPTGGTSPGDVSLATTPANVVTAIPPVSEPAKTITYKLSATSDAGVIGPTPAVVTFTIAAP